MATDRLQSERHETVVAAIEEALTASSWEARLAVVEVVDGLLGDLPSERTVEQLISVFRDRFFKELAETFSYRW